MHIYCDESGGIDKAKHSFVVAAVAIDPHDASRVMKAFKKKIGEKGEVKGSALPPGDRASFFNILLEESDGRCQVVCSTNNTPLGQWAAKSFSERNIYTMMLTQCCSGFESAGTRTINILPDGGRYPRNTIPAMTATISAALAAVHKVSVNISFSQSIQHAGIQVADIVSNSVYQALGAEVSDFSGSNILGGIHAAQRLTINPCDFSGLTPEWLK